MVIVKPIWKQLKATFPSVCLFSGNNKWRYLPWRKTHIVNLTPSTFLMSILIILIHVFLTIYKLIPNRAVSWNGVQSFTSFQYCVCLVELTLRGFVLTPHGYRLVLLLNFIGSIDFSQQGPHLTAQQVKQSVCKWVISYDRDNNDYSDNNGYSDKLHVVYMSRVTVVVKTMQFR